jgi:3-phenylpropionate/cinnamic acid dioxygenase small subunit
MTNDAAPAPAPAVVPSLPPLPPAELEREVTAFLHYEAELLDDRRFEEWLALFAPGATYEAPLRVTREFQAESELSATGRVFWDDRDTLAIRVQRLRSEYAWAEQPASRTRHFVTNIRVAPTDERAVSARANLLVYRSRGDDPRADLYSADRRDLLVRDPDGRLLISRRWLGLDQSNLTGNSLSIFL